MKEKQVTPAMIVGAIILLLLAGSAAFYFSTRGTISGPEPKATDAPAYTKPGYKGPAPYGPGANSRPDGGGGSRGGYPGGGSGYPGGGSGYPGGGYPGGRR